MGVANLLIQTVFTQRYKQQLQIITTIQLATCFGLTRPSSGLQNSGVSQGTFGGFYLWDPTVPSGLFPSGFPTKTLYTPLSSPIRATCPDHLILLDFITRTILGEEYYFYYS